MKFLRDLMILLFLSDLTTSAIKEHCPSPGPKGDIGKSGKHTITGYEILRYHCFTRY